MMFTKQVESFEAWTKPTKAAFDFWVSFWPVAPAFGVEWRFADAMPRFTPRILETGMERDEDGKKAGTRAKPAAKPTRKAATSSKAKAPVSHAEPAVAVIEAVEEAMAPVEAVVEAAIENVEDIVDAMSEAVAAPAAKPAPAEKAKPTETAEASGKPSSLMAKAPAKIDDLKLIKGIGPSLEKQLNGLGVYTFKQIAGFSEADLAWIDDHLTAFKGRCFRDDWIGQAGAQLG